MLQQLLPSLDLMMHIKVRLLIYYMQTSNVENTISILLLTCAVFCPLGSDLLALEAGLAQ